MFFIEGIYVFVHGGPLTPMQQGQVKVLELLVIVVIVVDVVDIVVVIRVVIRGVVMSPTQKVKLLESTKKVPCLPSHPDVEVYAPICIFSLSL